MEALYLKNITALATYCRTVDVSAIHTAAEAPLLIEPAKNGSPTAKTQGLNTLYLHSGYNPEREAEVFADGLQLQAESIVVLYGIGLGYQVEAMLRKMGDDNKLILVEPDFSILRAAFGIRDFTSILEDDRVFLMVNHTGKEIRGMLRGYFGMMNLDKAIFKTFPPYMHIFAQAYDTYTEIVNDMYHDIAIEINSLCKDGPAWQRNIIRNMPFLLDSIGVGCFKGKLHGIPAVIVSAGPSLDKNVGALRQFKGKGVIIAAYTAMKTLLSHGIEPDIVAAVDGLQLIHESEAERKTAFSIPLLYMPMTDYRLIEKHIGQKIVGLSTKDRFSTCIASHFHLEDHYLKLGGSVACTILDMAALAGCDPVIFVGQDLSYPSDGKTHAAGTHQAQKAAARKKQLFEVEDVFGGKAFTDSMLLLYAKWIERFVMHDQGNRLYIDATEGGIRIQGTEIMTLAEAGRYAVGDAADRLRSVFQAGSIFGQGKHLFHEYQAGCNEALLSLREIVSEALSLSRKLVEISERGERGGLWDQYFQELLVLEKKANRINDDTGLYDLTFRIAYFTILKRKKETAQESGGSQIQASQEKISYFTILHELLNKSL